MSILLRIVPPYLIRWCNLLAGRAVGQPYSAIQLIYIKKTFSFCKNPCIFSRLSKSLYYICINKTN